MQITTVDRRTRARRTVAIRETAAEKDFYTAINTEGEKDGKSEHLPTHTSRATPHVRSETSSIRSSRCSASAARPRRLVPLPRLPEGRGKLPARGWRCSVTYGRICRSRPNGRRAGTRVAPGQRAGGHAGIGPGDSGTQRQDGGIPVRTRPECTPERHGGVALRISELLLPRPWWIAEYGMPALLTSDEPVALHFRDRSRPPGHDRGIAYADEIWFPLDPRRLLILGRPGDPLPEQRLRPAAKTAVTVNLTIAARRLRAHLYAPRARPPERTTAAQTRPRPPGQRRPAHRSQTVQPACLRHPHPAP